MRTLRFYNKGRGASLEVMPGNSPAAPKLLHIETDGCVVNIQVGLRDSADRPVTRIDVSADGLNRGGDGQGRIWQAEVGPDSNGEGTGIRVIMTEDPSAHDKEAGR
jgi:hypothetical protein